MIKKGGKYYHPNMPAVGFTLLELCDMALDDSFKLTKTKPKIKGLKFDPARHKLTK
jgi:hypothetical protein